MGNKSGKNGNKPRESAMIRPNQTSKFDNVVVNRLRDDLNNEPELFILNNILISIQFFENFER